MLKTFHDAKIPYYFQLSFFFLDFFLILLHSEYNFE